jgi:thymidylate synthase
MSKFGKIEGNVEKKERQMSKADQLFVAMCKDILEHGTSTEGEKVRPHWEDGSSAYTIKKFGVVNRYNLAEEFPAITLRKTAIKTCTEEMLWIWQRKSNNIHDLNSTVWDEWADESGSIGKAYGYQLGVKHPYRDIDEKLLGEAHYPSATKGDDGIYLMDQVDRVIYDLKNNPFSRRIMTNIYVHADLSEMHLYPCAYSMTFNVTNDHGRLTLNAILNQRSQDVLAANNWNVCQYAVLVHMIAQVCDMQVGELVHVIADAHIYDRHVPIIEELIAREQHPAPKFTLNPEIKDFYQFTTADVKIEDYVTGEQIKNIPIAV